MLIVLFNNVREVIAVDALCKESRLVVKVMPVPERLSSECGMCLQCNPEDRNRMDELCQKNHIEVTYGEI